MGTSWIEGNGLVFGCGSVNGKWVEIGGNDEFSITVVEVETTDARSDFERRLEELMRGHLVSTHILFEQMAQGMGFYSSYSETIGLWVPKYFILGTFLCGWNFRISFLQI